MNVERVPGPRLYQSSLIARSHARRQVTAFAERTPGFHLDSVDDTDFPSGFVVTFQACGFGPPRDELVRPLDPTLRNDHTVRITLPPDFPVTPPVAIWLTPVFHPNIADGSVCLPLDTADLEEVCQAIVDLAAYRNYEVRPSDFGGGGFLNLAAAAWALSPRGQERIVSRGGTPRAAWSRPRAQLTIEPMRGLAGHSWWCPPGSRAAARPSRFLEDPLGCTERRAPSPIVRSSWKLSSREGVRVDE